MNPSAPTTEPGDDTVSTDVPTTSGRIAVDDDRILGGVAGFIAGRLGIDALWVRISFVLLALAGGIGLVLYAGLWLVLTADRSTSWRWPRYAGGAIVVIGIPLLLNARAGSFVTGPVAVVLLLSGLALALWRTPAVLGGPTAAGAAIDDRPPSSLASPLAAPAMSPARPGVADLTHEPRRSRLPRREPSVLGRATLGAAIVVAAIGALVDEANGGRLHPEQWLGAAAVVCGVGLLVGALRGHGRWLIVPAIVFAGAGYVSGVSARLGIDGPDTFGERWVSIGPQTPGGVRVAHSAFGTVDVYIDGVPDEPVVVDARVGIGDVTIRASDQVAVEVRSRVDDGGVTVDGSRRNGDQSVRLGPEGSPDVVVPDVVVTAWVGRGDVNIYTYDADERLRDMAPPVPVPELGLPQLDAPLAFVVDGVSVTGDGWFVLADGSAVIGSDDAIVVGEQFARDGVIAIPTSHGEFQLLPRSLLITPFGQVLDLQAIRAELAAAVPATTIAADTADPTTVVPSAPSLSTMPPTVQTTVQTTVPTTGG